jgi:uncharacterized tannase-like protein DUF6351
MRRAAWVTLVSLVVIASLITGGPAAAGHASDAAEGAALSATVVSSRPDTVSGGDALVRVAASAAVPLDRLTIRVDGTDVTGAFRRDGRRHALLGLVTGLDEGPNMLTATARGGLALPAVLMLKNHPRTGPVFAGPQETPFICDTEEFTLVNGERLGPPLDEDCSAETRTDYVYRRTTGELAPLPEGTTRPADLTWTTTSTGERVPYIVRVETGTINRAIYEIAMLTDPEDPAPSPWRHTPGWNGRLIYTFGGGCTTGWYHQGSYTGGVTQDGMLGQGYAVASSSLNVFGNNCNDLLAAESTAMVKERFAEAYGVPDFTIGWGCSGGAYQGHQIGDNYPGLLDGLVIGCSFPEVGFGTVHTITDARLLDHYFGETAPGTFTREQQRQVSGFGRWQSIANLAEAGGRIDPRVFCPEQLPAELRYDPETNPDGARCDVYSHTINAYGTDPDTGLARRPLDNVGIEYGRQALLEGTITVEQFLDLNEGIGGFDADANHVPERTVADPRAVSAAYGTGRLLNGGGGLAGMPIIDHREYTDLNANGDIHMRFQSFSTRERLEQANGTSANQVMLVEDGDHGGFTADNPIVAEALGQMDAWLTAMRADHAPGTDIHRVVRNRPAELTDACWDRETDARIVEPQEPGIGTTRCNTEYPVYTSPRMVAGAGIENDVIKCLLRPVDPASYGDVTMTGVQRERLRRIFRDGVCDWSRDGVGQQGLNGTWQFLPTSRP